VCVYISNNTSICVKLCTWSSLTNMFRVLCQEREQKAEEERIRMENILSGNPLLNLAGQQQQQQQQIVPTPSAFSVKRRWDDDVVFKNCAKGVDEARREKRFVNDTLRSEFHKKFMEKYVK
ncbi:unnamed protein product, partial [Oncorhynchus mykiss]